MRERRERERPRTVAQLLYLNTARPTVIRTVIIAIPGVVMVLSKITAAI